MEVGPYWLGKTLGEGSTCKVKLGLHRKTEDVVAIKILSKKKLSSKPRMRLKVDREMAVMRLIDHPNVLKLKDVYETPRHLFLVTEYAENGEVFDYLVKRGQLSEWEARRLFLQLVHGLLYCKRHLICHRDLKPENLLLDKYNNLKIADFGMASLNREDAMLKTSCGSPHYASPEIVRGDEYDGFKSDVWSCGVILYALLAGYLPFDDDDIRKLLEMVRDGEYEMPTSMPHGARDLIEHMLVVDPERRYSLEDVVAHPWLTSHASGMALARLAPPVEVDRDTPITSADPWVLSNLIAIGFATDDKQLRTVLSSPGPRIEKVFYRLLEARRDQCQQARQRSRSMDPQTSPLSVPAARSGSRSHSVATQSVGGRPAPLALNATLSPNSYSCSSPARAWFADNIPPTPHGITLDPVRREGEVLSPANTLSATSSGSTASMASSLPISPCPMGSGHEVFHMEMDDEACEGASCSRAGGPRSPEEGDLSRPVMDHTA